MMSRYVKITRIGYGGDGHVYKCLDLKKCSFVAVKWIPFGNTCNGIPGSILREISILRELDHPNIVRLFRVVDASDGVHLVLEYIKYDLAKIIKDHSKIMNPHVIKSFLFQILQGVEYCHSLQICHRDLKPQNLLVDLKTKTIKLADFGDGRTLDSPLTPCSVEMTTLAYKAPEVLLGIEYGSAADVWSVGCIFAEMVNRQPLFVGTLPAAIMTKIIRMFGVPNDRDWPGVTFACLNLCEMETLPSEPIPDLADVVPGLESEGVDLLSKMLCMAPNKRIIAYDALRHPYFKDFERSLDQ